MPDEAVTLYVTFCKELTPEFSVNVPVIEFPEPDISPVTFMLSVTIQE